MKRRVLQTVTAIVLSASLLFEVAAPVAAAQTEPEAVDAAVEEEIAVETVSGNGGETPAPKPTVGRPSSISGSVADEKTIKLTWGAVSGAAGYEIESNTNDAGFVKLWSFDGNVTSMDVLATADMKQLNIASSYKFRVRAFVKDGTDTIYGEYSDVTPVLQPSRAAKDWILTSEPVDYRTITLAWRPASGVSGYKILIATKPNGPFSVLTTEDEPMIKISKDASGKDLSLSKKYYFKVQAFIKNGTNEYVSEESPAVLAQPELQKPEITYLNTYGGDFVKIKWSKSKGADGYEVYRSTKKKKVGTVIAGGKKIKGQNKIKNLKKKNLIDRDATPGTKYWYRVRAYKTIKGKRYYSDYDLWAKAAVTVLASTNFVKEGCVCEKPNVVKLSWKKVDKAKGYFIQRSSTENGTYQLVATVENGDTTAYEIEQGNGTKYYYQIVCYNDKNKKKSWSYPCDPVRMTSNYYCYPSETYQERCQRVFAQDYYHAYSNQTEADSRMENVGFEQWSTDPKKKTTGYTVKTLKTFKVNKKVQPTVQQIINEVQAYQITQGVNLKIESASGYDFTSAYQEDREGVTVKVKVVGGTPGTAEYNAVATIMAKYGFNKVSNYTQSYDPDRYVYVGVH